MPGGDDMAREKTFSTEEIAAAQREAALALRERAACEPAVAEVICGAHRELKLWRLCTQVACRRSNRCGGDALGCAARYWPVACSAMEEIAAAVAQGEPPAQAAARHLAEWSDQDGVLTHVVERQVMWEDTAMALGRAVPSASGRRDV
jgi:hypothetical protein